MQAAASGARARLVGVFDLEALTTLLSRDPVLAYSLLAALFLAIVSLATGIARRDAAALLYPTVLLRVALSVALALVLVLLAESLVQAYSAEGTSWTLLGLRRFPLYLLALAYGPSVGLCTALLFAAFEASGGWPGWTEAVLALELVAIGWLAIYPTPRTSRFAGPFNALVAYALAWGTAGLALLEYQTGAVTGSGIWQQHQGAWLGLLLSVLLLALVRPGTYRRLFPHSRIDPLRTVAAPRGNVIEVEPFESSGTRHSPSLTVPDLPERLLRPERVRELDPPHFDSDEELG